MNRKYFHRKREKTGEKGHCSRYKEASPRNKVFSHLARAQGAENRGQEARKAAGVILPEEP